MSEAQQDLLVDWAFPPDPEFDDDDDDNENDNQHDDIALSNVDEIKNTLRDISENDALFTPKLLIDKLAKQLKQQLSEEETILLQQQLFPDLRFRTGSKKPSKRSKPPPDYIAGALEASQIKHLGSWFLSLLKASMTPGARSQVKTGEISDKTINSNIINILNAVIRRLPAVDASLQTLWLPTNSANVIVQLFHDTVHDCRRGLGIQSKAGVEQCRGFFADKVNYLSTSNIESERKAYEYLKVLNKPPGPFGGAWTYFNMIPSYHEIRSKNKNEIQGVLTTQGAYVSNVGAGVPVKNAIVHMATLIKAKIIIPQPMKLSLLILVDVDHPGVSRLRVLDLINEQKREMYEEALSRNINQPSAEASTTDTTTTTSTTSATSTTSTTTAAATTTTSFRADNNILSDSEKADLNKWALEDISLPFLNIPIFLTVAEQASSILQTIHHDLGDRTKALDVYVSRGYGKHIAFSYFIFVCFYLWMLYCLFC